MKETTYFETEWLELQELQESFADWEDEDDERFYRLPGTHTGLACAKRIDEEYDIPPGTRIKVCISTKPVPGAIKFIRDENPWAREERYANNYMECAMRKAGISPYDPDRKPLYWWVEVPV